MIEIDGSYGEGGGQILRTSIALSSLTFKPVRIYNIRKKRSNPGLRPQHFMGIKVAAEFCDAKVKGLEIGSTEIEFVPGRRKIPEFKEIDIGTAGSIGLLLQTILPLLLFAEQPVKLRIKGGTAGLGAPPIDYVKYVKIPLLRKMGCEIEMKVVRHGFYPKGGGIVEIFVKPVERLKPLELMERGDLRIIRGISVVGSLPSHIAERQARAAEEMLKEFPIEIKRKVEDTFSPGTCITLWAECENSVLGGDALGKKGKPAEEVGREAANSLLEAIRSGAALDKHMADQILLYLSLAKGKSRVSVEGITQHCLTNAHVIRKILGIEVRIDEKRKIIEVDGIGLNRNPE